MTADASHVDAIHCPHCGYNLFGIDSQRCPECGSAIDRTLVGQSNLPWTHRRSIGRWRAFWRTVLLAIFRPTRLAQEMNRPVRYADAILFRRICVLVGWASMVGFGIWGFATSKGYPLDWWERGVGMASLSLGEWVWLMAITGLPSIFFHPRSLPVLRQNRAIALSFYSSAPLVFLPLATVAYAAGFLVDMKAEHDWYWRGWDAPFYVVAFIAAIAVYVLLPSCAMMLLGRTTRCGAVRKWGMFALNFVWMILLFYLIGLGIPLLAFCLEIMVRRLMG